MEGELWEVVYRLIEQEDKHRDRASLRGRRLRYADADVAAVLAWAALHDRPVSWACLPENWLRGPDGLRPWVLPSQPTVSRRLRTVPVLQLLERVLAGLAVLT